MSEAISLSTRFCAAVGWKGRIFLIASRTRLSSLKGDSGLRLLLAPFEFESQFKKEEFFEDQPDVGWSAGGLQVRKALAGIGPVNLPQRILSRNQAHAFANHGWNWVYDFGRDILQQTVDDAAKPAWGQAALSGRLVDGDDPADFERGSGFLLSPFTLFGRVS